MKIIVGFLKWLFRNHCSVCGVHVDNNGYSPICKHCLLDTPPAPPIFPHDKGKCQDNGIMAKFLHVIYSSVYDDLTCKEVRDLFPEFEQLRQ